MKSSTAFKTSQGYSWIPKIVSKIKKTMKNRIVAWIHKIINSKAYLVVILLINLGLLQRLCFPSYKDIKQNWFSISRFKSVKTGVVDHIIANNIKFVRWYYRNQDEIEEKKKLNRSIVPCLDDMAEISLGFGPSRRRTQRGTARFATIDGFLTITTGLRLFIEAIKQCTRFLLFLLNYDLVLQAFNFSYPRHTFNILKVNLSTKYRFRFWIFLSNLNHKN